MMTISTGSVFIIMPIFGSFIGVNIVQFIIEPIDTAIRVIIIIGVVVFVLSSLIWSNGADKWGAHISIIIIRIE